MQKKNLVSESTH